MIGIEMRVSGKGTCRIQRRILLVKAICPKETIGHKRIAIDIFQREIRRIDKHIIQCNEVVAPRHAMIIGNKGVVKQVDWFANTSATEVLAGFLVVHEPQTGFYVVFNKVALDQKEAVRAFPIANELDAILIIPHNGIAPDDDIQGWTAVGLKPDLDTIVTIMANEIILNDHRCLSVQVDGIITIIFKEIMATEATAPFVVNCIAVANKAVMQDLQSGGCADAIIAILDRKPHDCSCGSNRWVNGDYGTAPTIDNRLLDQAGIIGCIKMGDQADRFSHNLNIFIIVARADENNVAISRQIDRALNRGHISRNMD